MAKPREYTWYLEPKGNVAHSNEILGKNIGEENALQDVLCADGKLHNLWRCPSGLVFMLWNSRKNFSMFGKKFAIRIFCREGNGKIRDVTGLYRNQHAKKRTGAKI